MATVLNDRYELRRPIGAGGMAEVFEAHDRRLQRTVAIKVLRADVPDPQARQRFEREARMAAKFAHPNAVTIYDVDEDRTRPYLVMELVHGETLSDRLQRHGRLDAAETVGIIDALLAVLGAAHQQGLVHRDVKPSNVLLAEDGAVKLADFGIARAISDATMSLTMTGQVLGTPKYLSPEQVEGQPSTAQSDLYSLGIMFYEMLAGEAPFTGDSPVAIANAHRHAPVPHLATERLRIRPALAAVVERALAKDPTTRYPSAAVMRQALRDASANRGRSHRDEAMTLPLATIEPTLTQQRPVTRSSVPTARPRRDRRRVLVLLTTLVAVVVLAIGVAVALNRPSGGPSPASPSIATPTTNARLPTATPVTRPLAPALDRALKRLERAVQP
jgi:serine/threonine-protein kinase